MILQKNFPSDEISGLIRDMNRAVNLISHNFAQVFGRFEPGIKSRIYKISCGSG